MVTDPGNLPFHRQIMINIANLPKVMALRILPMGSAMFIEIWHSHMFSYVPMCPCMKLDGLILGKDQNFGIVDILFCWNVKMVEYFHTQQRISRQITSSRAPRSIRPSLLKNKRNSYMIWFAAANQQNITTALGSDNFDGSVAFSENEFNNCYKSTQKKTVSSAWTLFNRLGSVR